MSELIAVAYPDEFRAGEVRATFARLQHEYFADLDDLVVVTKGQDGKLKLHQSRNLAGAEAVWGGIWGGLIGMLFLMPVAGAAVGAASGALIGRHTDLGIDDKFVKQLSEKLTPGTSALFVLLRSFTADRVTPELAKFGGTILRTSLSVDAETKLQAALTEGAKVATPA